LQAVNERQLINLLTQDGQVWDIYIYIYMYICCYHTVAHVAAIVHMYQMVGAWWFENVCYRVSSVIQMRTHSDVSDSSCCSTLPSSSSSQPLVSTSSLVSSSTRFPNSGISRWADVRNISFDVALKSNLLNLITLYPWWK